MAPPAKTLISAACTLVRHNRTIDKPNVEATTLRTGFSMIFLTLIAIFFPDYRDPSRTDAPSLMIFRVAARPSRGALVAIDSMSSVN
jgi:hypothetical protein